MLVFVPLFLGYWLWIERRPWQRPRRLLQFLGLLVLPLLLYLWLPFGSARGLPPGTWHPATLAQWLAYLQDKGYIGAIAVQTNLIPKLTAYAKDLISQFGWFGLVLGLVGLAHQLRARKALAVVIGLGFALQAVLSASYEVPRNWVFFLPSFLLFVLWIGEGLGGLLHLAWGLRARQWAAGYAADTLALLSALVLIGVTVLRNYPALRIAHLDGGALDIWRQDLKAGYLGERFATYSLEAVEPNSIIVADWEQATALWYYQQIEGRRPDVEIIYPISRWQEALATGRPCYLARCFPGLGDSYHLSTVGPLVCVSEEPLTSMPPEATSASIQWDDGIDLVGYRVYQSDFQAGYVLPVSLFFRANQPLSEDYSLSLRLWTEDGTQVWSYDRQDPVLGMYPMTRWAPGEVVADYSEVPFPRSLPSGRYRLGIILYASTADGGWRNLKLRGEETDIAYFLTVGAGPRP